MLCCFSEILQRCASVLWAELCGGLIFFYAFPCILTSSQHTTLMDYFFFPPCCLQLLPEIPVSSS